MLAHRQLLAKRTQGRIDIYFVGNSITRRWGATDYPELLANWKANFYGWNAADFGWGGDKIQNMLWRLEQGELDGVNPKVIVILPVPTTSARNPAATRRWRTLFAASGRSWTRAGGRLLTRRSS